MIVSEKIFKINKQYLFVFSLMFVLLLFYMLCVEFSSQYLSNMVFVDGVNWHEFIKLIIAGDVLFLDIRSSWVGFAFYLLLYTVGGYFLVVFANYFIVSYSLSRMSFSVILPFVFLPFYLLCIFLPSKDILVLALTVILIPLLSKKYFISALFVSLLIMLLRDAYGVVAIGMIVLLYMKLNNRSILLLILLLSFILDYFLVFIANFTGFFVFERTLGYFIQNNESYHSYLVRVFANITNLGARYVLYTETGKLSLTGISYMLSGGGVFAAFVVSIRALAKNRDNEILSMQIVVSYFYILVIILFSISPLIQPRYLIPIAFMVLSVYVKDNSKKSMFLLLFSSYVFLNILRFVYVYSGIGLPEVEDFDFVFHNIF